METFKTIDDALALSRFAHRNQKDKAGKPYIEHPLRVWATVRLQGANEIVQMAAVTHDVVEDTAFTLNILAELGFPVEMVQLVHLLTRTKSVHTDDYYRAISKNPGALMIKLADIKDNSREDRLDYLPSKTQKRLREKYAHALFMLTGDRNALDLS